MCGRFSLTTDEELLNERFRLAGSITPYVARYNCAPTQLLAVVSSAAPGHISYYRWGLVPFWASDMAIGNKLINAKAETIAEKPSFRNAFRSRRCLVLSDGFYEWKQQGKLKIPYRITLNNGQPFAMAGIWETWKDAGGISLYTFAIITTQANELMKPIHERMPVILSPEDEYNWLENSNHMNLQELLRPYEPDAMQAYSVSTLVNSPRNDGPEVFVAIEKA